MRNSRRRGFGSSVALLLCGAAVSCQPDPRRQHHHLEIRDLAFPSELRSVASGDTITWINGDIVPHTVSEETGAWDSGDLPTSGSFTLVVPPDADSVAFHCDYHPFMRGSIRVR